MSKTVRKNSKNTQNPTGAKRRPVRPERMTLLAMQHDTLVEAAAATRSPRLGEWIKTWPELRSAWERGSFLRQLRLLAEVGTPKEEAEKHLESMRPQTDRRPGWLAELLATDAEARDIWNKAPIAVIRAIRAARVESAKEGDARAATAVLNEFRDESVRKRANYRALTMKEFAELVEVSPQTGYNWKKDGMPCNADGTVNLGRFLGWYEKKIRAEEAGREADASPGDRLRETRANKMAMEMDKERGRLIERETVLATLASRARQLAQVLDRAVDPLTRAVHGHTLDQIRRRVEESFAGIRAELAKPIQQPPWLPEESLGVWQKLLEGIM